MCVLTLFLSVWPDLPAVHAQEAAENHRRFVEDLGTGTSLVITPHVGPQLKGVVTSVGTDVLALQVSGRQEPAEIGWVSIKKLALPSDTYKTTGATDLNTVRPLLLFAWSEVKFVEIRTRGGTKVRGRVESVFPETFACRTDADAILELRYDEITEVKPKPWSTSRKVITTLGVTVGAFVGLLGLGRWAMSSGAGLGGF